ncbi:cytochrome P450 monooxygenase [Rhodococcus wratislaviensis]|uniref:Cytochrome P450 monooxygenase n=1 Tax=Rhodococcus wratislaviensis TaxID=44752 RepID=A0A402CMY7_RHOWR|nr:cytochrome P450 [Rhodococcus wratislaviensis]GCE45096.1 cytochrome P450 monooxygenase [Rhodococcus wratislaviensis]
MTALPAPPPESRTGTCPFTANGEDREDSRSVSSSVSAEAQDGTAVRSAPVADWVVPQELATDPYPIYARLRAESPVAWVPALGKFLVTGYAQCHAIELDQDTYSAQVSGTGATMTRTLGENPMLRKDDPEHTTERHSINPTLRPKAIKQVWTPIFERNARTYIDTLAGAGPDAAELNRDYAAPVASQNLIDLLGLPGVDPETMRRWSHAFIAGTGNLLDDPDIWAAADTARTEVDTLLDELIPFYEANPNDSMTSALANSGLPHPAVAANVKLTITGGMNEPQHMVTNMVWALDHHRDQHRRVIADHSLWPAVFDETARWLSPIGMYPRQTTRSVVLGGVTLPAGAPIGVVVGAANRDKNHFTHHPDTFDIFRPKQPHLAFGSGVHLCAGHWAAKTSIGQLAVPLLFERFPTLRVDNRRETSWDGWVFRGLTTLPVTWDN